MSTSAEGSDVASGAGYIDNYHSSQSCPVRKCTIGTRWVFPA